MATVLQSGIKAGPEQSQVERLAYRTADLMVNDSQFRAALPLSSVSETLKRPGMRLAEIMSVVMEAYAERPALGQRVRQSSRLQPEFQTISYGELWARTRALASAWHHDQALRIAAGDFICILGFAGIDYVTVDLAAIHRGAVTIPLQTNAPTEQLRQIIAEVGPRCLATSMDWLDTAVELVLSVVSPTHLIVFDFQSDDTAKRTLLHTAQQRLADAGSTVLVKTLIDMCEHGATLAPAPLFVAAPNENPLSTIYYTSGSTGSPKGAMYLENMVKGPWLSARDKPLIYLHYMPMNHSWGRSIVFRVLANGGICYFTAKSDLSTLFQDIGLVRPTEIALAPRICEMIHHQFQVEMERHNSAHTDTQTLGQEVMASIRQNFMGGRILACPSGSAPIGAELRSFIETCLEVPLIDAYGTTETSGIAVNTRILRPPIVDYKLVDVPELGYYRSDKPYPRGELLVKTTNLMAGYFKKPELSASILDEEGYYKTGDIMAEIGPDQITYLDRRNNVLKLAQGEFVALANLEATFAAGDTTIRQIYLYGSSERSYLLAVIVPSVELASGKPKDETAIKSRIRHAIMGIAKTQSLRAYEVPRDFLVELVPFSVENGLLAGVGKYLRPAFKAHYGARLDTLYTEIDNRQANELKALRQSGQDVPVLETIVRAAQATLGLEAIDLNQHQTFSELGGDSLTALAFSSLLGETFKIDVPVGVITNPASDLVRVAHFVEQSRNSADLRPSFTGIHGRGATHVYARDLTLDKFIDAHTLEAAKSRSPLTAGAIKTVLLTGANGYLGRFLCLEWLERLETVGGKLVCIVRAQDEHAARKRLADAFDSGDPGLAQHFDNLAAQHLQVLAGDISEANLGLDGETWNHLAETVDLIVHPAALVNHVLPYAQLFGPNVVGTAELIRLAMSVRLKAFNYVSTIAAATLDSGTSLSEDVDIRLASAKRILNDTRYASGYATSKWAGEVLLRAAHEYCGLPVTVFRSDMILAHRRYVGQINVPDMFTRLIFSLAVTGIAPSSFYRSVPGFGIRAHYDGLPVDFTAAAIAELVTADASGYRTYHVLNPHDDGISLDQIVDWMIESGVPLRRIDNYADWLQRFETALRALPDRQRQRSSLALLDHLRQPAIPVQGSSVSADRFHSDVRRLGIGADKDIPHLSARLIKKYVDDLRQLKLI